MPGSKVCLCALLVTVLAAVCLAVPLPETLGDAGAALAHRDALRERARALRERTPSGAPRDPAQGARVARQDRLGSLTEEQRDLVSRYVLQALTELAHREGCSDDHPINISDRDYHGWMDFGRRSAEELDS
ncbi:gastrin/cholecystokinin-like peptide [Lepisosteus oculatus]|uniref:gastrin/cholecystokinin-like peptide n=1 Tax=Lepisosteus oculatus TaxID=7918 RepID=UPI0003EADA71|nr:PREDICTED: gastrin/cholecystokinin-like peptide [Lepisosteus oculatus]